MKFLIISQYFYPEIGATQTRLSAMCRELIRQGHRIEVITALPNYPAGVFFPGYTGTAYKVEEWQGMLIHRLWVCPATGSGLKRLISYVTFVVSALVGLALIREKPDYVFVDSPPPFIAVVGRIYSLLRGVPFIFNVADLWPDTVVQMNVVKNKLMLKAAYKLESLTYRWAKYINAVTYGNIATLIEKKHVPNGKILFLPNGVDIHLFRSLKPAAVIAQELKVQNKMVILFAGGLGYAQGLDVVIETMNILRVKKPQIVFVFLGEGPEKARLRHATEELHLSNILFVDGKPLSMVPLYYSIAFAGFASLRNIPLFEEVRPSKIYPVMACGKPLVYSGSGETARIIREADCGIVVPPEDPRAAADAISLLAQYVELALRYGQNGRRYVERNHDWSVIVENWLAALSQNEKGTK